jgi:hypothetical protein
MQKQPIPLVRISKRIDSDSAELEAILAEVDTAMQGNQHGVVDVSRGQVDDINRRLRNIGRRFGRVQVALQLERAALETV